MEALEWKQNYDSNVVTFIFLIFFSFVYVPETYKKCNLFPHSFPHFSESIDRLTVPACCICHADMVLLLTVILKVIKTCILVKV